MLLDALDRPVWPALNGPQLALCRRLGFAMLAMPGKAR
jgi:hypothetical protein